MSLQRHVPSKTHKTAPIQATANMNPDHGLDLGIQAAAHHIVQTIVWFSQYITYNTQQLVLPDMPKTATTSKSAKRHPSPVTCKIRSFQPVGVFGMSQPNVRVSGLSQSSSSTVHLCLRAKYSASGHNSTTNPSHTYCYPSQPCKSAA